MAFSGNGIVPSSHDETVANTAALVAATVAATNVFLSLNVELDFDNNDVCGEDVAFNCLDVYCVLFDENNADVCFALLNGFV